MTPTILRDGGGPVLRDSGPADPVKHFEYIDALRGWAFLLVALTHCGFYANLAKFGYEGLVRNVCAFGISGVQLFYLLSALTLFRSMDARSGKDRRPTFAFFARRFFRVAPLFWVAVAGYLFWYGVGPRYYAREGISAWNIALTALFLNGWHPYTINAIVPGGWSIAVEMVFYLLLPTLHRHFRSPGRQVGLLVAALGVAFVIGYKNLPEKAYPGIPAEVVGELAFFWLPSQFPVFVLGLLLYSLLNATSDRLEDSIRLERGPFLWSLAGLVVAGFAGALEFARSHVQNSVFFCLLIWGLSLYPSRLVVNPITSYFGKISYSAYITHMVAIDISIRLLGLPGGSVRYTSEACESLPQVLHLAGLPGLVRLSCLLTMTLLLTLAFSTATHHLIEKPGIDLGRRLIRFAGWGR